MARDSEVLESWLARLGEGDLSARNEIIARSAERLQKLTRRMLRQFPKVKRWEDTDNVLQEVLLRLHRRLETARPASASEFFNLAAAEIRRQLIDFYRKLTGSKSFAAHHSSDPLGIKRSAQERKTSSHRPYDPVSFTEWGEFHLQAETLPEDSRQVFSLRWYQGLTFPEIARTLDLSERTVKRRWRSACLQLYNAFHGEPPREESS